MEVYVARQPIFDSKMNVYGYELLYRRSTNNFYEGISDNQATAEVINNAFMALEFHDLTEGKRGFINFTEDMLLKEIPRLLPKDQIIVEILERVTVSDNLIKKCKSLKESGYILALDDYVLQESFTPLFELIDIIKVEYPSVKIQDQKNLIKTYQKKFKFLAEKVETREEYQTAVDMGYDYFQGYFFSKPIILKGNDIPNINGNLIRIIHELKKETPNYQNITKIIETDLGLSYKLLRLANSIFFGTLNQIHSIRHALVRLGIDETRKWIYLMMLKEIQRIENKEFVKNTLVRAKMMELLAVETGLKKKQLTYFMVGLFSSIDILLNRKMEEIVDELALSDEVKDTLLGVNNQMKQYLKLVIEFEQGEFQEDNVNQEFLGIRSQRFMELYREALGWTAELELE